MTLRARLAAEWLIIALFSSVLVIILLLGGFTQRLDNLVYDVGLSFQSIAPSDEIIVIAIDEPSLDAQGSWPWSREAYVPLLDNLGKAGAGAVAFDILFTEPQNESLRGDPAGTGVVNADAALAEAMARNGNVVAAMQFLRPGSNGQEQDRLSPVSPIAQAAAATGHVELITDNDTVVRRVALCLDKTADRETPHLMVAALNHSRRSKGETASNPHCDMPYAMPFLPAAAFRTTSFSSAANGEIPASFFRDKIVLVGATAAGLGDQHRVPAVQGEASPGIIVMANALNALIQDRFITPAPTWAQLVMALLPLWLLLALLWRARPRTVFVAALILLALTLFLSLALLQLQLWFAPVATIIALILVYPLWGWRRLQAASDYMGRELDRMDDGAAEVPIIDRQFRPADIVTEQAEKLASAIARLRDMRRFVSNTVASLPDPMVVVDEDRHIVMANQDAEDMLGSDLNDADLRERLRILTRADSQEPLIEYLNSDAKSEDEESIFEFRTRQDQHFAMRRSAVLSSTSERLGTIFYFADITDIRRADREREEVLQLLSHDMRGPQAAILALLDQNRANTPEALRNRIVRQARRTLSLADNFVDIARMTAQPFTPEDVLFGDLVAEASEDLWPMASARNIRFEVDDRSDAAFVAGERASLSRTFVNLFDNAVKYSPDGGTIRVRLDRIVIDKVAYVRCVIEDEGKGIDKPIMERLFTAFASTQEKNKASKVSGVGLGLHYVQTVILRHGGEISADNAESGGACFTLLLPMLDEELLEEE
ncbi:CHASE2 domain-containing protein [Alterisphingorhabdus coralli]|uniref:histidine kinase n=1 Tax=Alterisphingorhabdus coralli TaxID=3071408 RepID=A0AA97I0W1_9SPHN|nr:CHASE2 domain-containing protein [Parasphingorhabdus sp. SCSIO 66989]WOE76099.1 CHASE2 domain-containing protein [Parasphingorhabdus sp. SCSIO 66989]